MRGSVAGFYPKPTRILHRWIVLDNYWTAEETTGMFVRMVWGRLKPGAWDEYEKYYQEKVFPFNDKVNGLLSRAILRGIDGEDEAVSLSTWGTEEALRGYEDSNLRKQFADDIQKSYATSWSYITGEYWVKTFQVVNVTKYE